MTETSNTGRGRKLALWIGGAIVALVVLVVGGTWVYINLIKDDAPEELSFEERDEATAATDAPATDAPTTVATESTAAATAAASTTAAAAAVRRRASTGHGRRPPSPSSATG